MRRSVAASKHRRGKGLALSWLVLVTALVLAATAGATVWTNQDDYAPGDTVTISGDNSNAAGYLTGEVVHVAVSGPNAWTATCDAVADAAGAWSCQVTLAEGPEAIGEYTYTATGLLSGVSESGTFTDGGVRLRAMVGAAAIAVPFPAASVQGFLDGLCTPPANKSNGAFTTLTTGAYSFLGGMNTATGTSMKFAAPSPVETPAGGGVWYVFHDWQITNAPNNPATDCFSGWNAGADTLVTANYELADPEIKVEKTATAEYFVAGGPVGFQYTVTNEGNVPLSSVGVTDSEYVGPTYQSGDTNSNTLLDLTETWIFTGSYTPTFTGPSSILDNVATATGTFATTTVDDKKGFKLMGAVIRKAVHLYWQAGGPDKIVPYDAPGVYFDVDLYERGVGKVGTEQVAEDDPLQLWLTLKPTNQSGPGWQFVEQAKTGYPVADDRGTIGFSVVPGGDYLDSTLINTIDFNLSIRKSAPKFVGENGVVTFTYEVKNVGPAAVTPVVTDDKCSPVEYVSGDANTDGLIQPTEKWIFECDDTLSWYFGWNFDTGKQLCDTNTATVVDDEQPDPSFWNPWEFYGGESQAQRSNNRNTVTLCPWIIRKDVIEFGTGNQLGDTTPFTVTIKQGSTTVGTVTIKEGDPAQFWLQPGTYDFYETVLPFYIPNFEHWWQTAGVDYPDWTVVNSRWYGFSHGYYKNQGARIGWGNLTPPAAYAPSQTLESVFVVPDAFDFDDVTLLQALSFKGGPDLAGKAEILLRQAVAALLNESRFGASFGDFTLAELVTNVNTALAGSESDMTQLAGVLAMWNNGQVVTP